jgi:hypothetical protein
MHSRTASKASSRGSPSNRTGTHFNTAFALILAWNGQRRTIPELAALIPSCAADYFAEDRNCPGWEPGGDEFLTSSLTEALLMQRVLPPEQFRSWFGGLLPNLVSGEPKSLFTPATVSDRSDGKIAHLDGST